MNVTQTAEPHVAKDNASRTKPRIKLIMIEPMTTTIEPGNTFNIAVQVQAGNQTVDTAQSNLNFYPAIFHLQMHVADGITTAMVQTNVNDQVVVVAAWGKQKPWL